MALYSLRAFKAGHIAHPNNGHLANIIICGQLTSFGDVTP